MPADKKKWRIGMIGIYHESNTFIEEYTTVADFENGHLFFGAKIISEYEFAYHEIGGMIEVFRDHPVEIIPIMYAEATPGGMLDANAANHLINKMVSHLNLHLPMDGIMVMPHGAAVSEIADDFDGQWLSVLRNLVGDIPVIGTLDPHANVSQKMVQATNALIAYKTNPHVDQRAVGAASAQLMIDTLKGKIRPVQHVLPSVVAISIDQQYTATEPCLGLYQLAQKIEQKPGVLSVSILLGFPYADVPEMGSAFVVVTDDDVSLAERLLKTLELHMVEHHEEFQGPKTSLQEALQQIEKLDKPVLLLDMGDNVGGGSPGDGTFLLHALDTKKNCRSFVCINDPEVVARLMHLSPGQTTEIEIGAKTDNRHGIPFKTPLRLRRVLEGRFSERQARHGGQVNFDMGPTLLGETPHGTTIMVTSRRMVPFSLQQLLHFNVNPLDFDVIVAKGVQAPIAAYSTVCPSIIRVNTAGVTCADMHQFIYHKRRKPLFPFETIK